VSPLSETVVSWADGSPSMAVATLPSGRATSEACVPCPASTQLEKPTARDPTKDPATPSPTPTMRPARSQPGVYGAVMLAGSHDAIPPVTIPRSAGLIVAASAAISTSPAAGAGSATSSTRRFSIPQSSRRTARMLSPSVSGTQQSMTIA